MSDDLEFEIPWKTPKERYQFTRHYLTFSEVKGEPTEFNDSLGSVCLSFTHLENEVSAAIIKMINVNAEIGKILLSEQPFKNKLNLFGSLFQYYKSTHRFNSLFPDEEETFNELLKACFQCEVFRNQILHSDYHFTHPEIYRKKITAKATKGLTENQEKVDSAYILEISDYIYETGSNVEEFFFTFEKK
ncbi:MAG: hypothetical protein ABSD71_05570 [Bacteroidales bacterium]|jgi:hypothetical protein